ncbi:MAG: hypothetical protein ISQ09_07255 [Rubripirellula sp.]|nr:hypothetical protein [Rubripirellula sp.]
MSSWPSVWQRPSTPGRTVIALSHAFGQCLGIKRAKENRLHDPTHWVFTVNLASCTHSPTHVQGKLAMPGSQFCRH